jgi:hypothetical protein
MILNISISGNATRAPLRENYTCHGRHLGTPTKDVLLPQLPQALSHQHRVERAWGSWGKCAANFQDCFKIGAGNLPCFMLDVYETRLRSSFLEVPEEGSFLDLCTARAESLWQKAVHLFTEVNEQVKKELILWVVKDRKLIFLSRTSYILHSAVRVEDE